MREPIEHFAKKMEAKLVIHDRKRGERGWLRSNPQALMDWLRGEVQELQEALAIGTAEDIQGECVDVANMAMMVSDWIRKDCEEAEPDAASNH